MTSGTWWCPVVIEMVLCLKRSGGCLERHDVFVLPLFCTLRGQWLLWIQAGRWSLSEVSLSLSVPCTRAGICPSLAAQFRELNPQETISVFSIAHFWLVWLPALPHCRVVWAPMLVQAKGGHFHGWSVGVQDFGSLVRWSCTSYIPKLQNWSQKVIPLKANDHIYFLLQAASKLCFV